MSASRSRDVAIPHGVDPYVVLGVSPEATGAEIKAAYRALVKRHHPDAGGSEDRIVALNAAWEVLRDEQSRHRYDAVHHPGSARPQPPATATRPARAQSGALDDAQLIAWLQQVYGPIDRLL
ncbi:MAG: J domain-containing protein, partial [Cyanobium sp.]